VAALVVTVFFVWRSSKLPSVRASMFVPDGLKLLAIGVGVAAGILEEWLFRGILMDWLGSHGLGALLQVAVSGLAFGLMHAVWAFFRGSWRAGFTATLATGVLGIGLAVVYLAGGRNLAPCIVAHFWVDALCEPGLMLAAVRGEMGRALPAKAAA
jgi:membrane protease YdiL (CAAX protease family)